METNGAGKNVKVSVVMPVYNVGAYLAEALGSLSRQTLEDIEVICIDDGSRDGSADIALRASHDDSRIRCVSQANSGAAAARNRGLALARGEYLSFLDADDVFAPDMLERMYREASSCDADVCVCEYRDFREGDGGKGTVHRLDGSLASGALETRDLASNLFQLFCSCAWDKLVRRELVESEGLRFQELPNANDLLFAYLALACSRRICVVHEPFVGYRCARPGSIQTGKAAHPLCALEAVGALRADARLKRLEDRGIGRSLDGLSVRVFVESFESLAGVPDAARAVYDSFIGRLQHEWGLADKSLAYFEPASLRFKYGCLRRAGFDRAIRAYQGRGEARPQGKAALAARLFWASVLR